MSESSSSATMTFGIGSMLLATLALIVAVAHLSFGPFAPQQPVEKTIVDTAVAIKDYAKRAVTGEEKPSESAPAPSQWNADRIVDAGTIAFASLAMLLALVALIRREQRLNALMGFSLGAGVLLMAWLQWIALLICGAILLAAIISNLGDILPS